MLGANLPDLDHDAATLSLLTNDEVLAIDQDPLGAPAKRVMQANGAEIWVKPLKNGDQAIGLFNRSEAAQTIDLDWKSASLTGRRTLRNLWTHSDLGTFDEKYTTQVPSHGAVLLRAR